MALNRWSDFGTRSKLFAGNSNLTLAKNVADSLKVQLGKADITKFSDGEIRVEINEHVRSQHVFILQSTCAPTNDNLMEMLILADAMRRSAVKSLTAIIPYYGYSRQDRRPDYSRTPITSRLIADMIETAGFDFVILVDIHSGQQQGFFKIPTMNISAAPLFVMDIWRKYGSDLGNAVIVSPDSGGVVRARAIAKQLDNVGLAIIDKRRPQANVAEVMNVIGNVEGKTCIIIDDMIDTASTLCKGASVLRKFGANKVVAYATHGVFSGSAYSNISESVLDEVIITDTIPLRPEAPSTISVISITNIIAETLRRLRAKVSVSEMYI